METLRRARFVFACVCLLLAVVLSIALFGQPFPAAVPWLIAALSSAFAFYMSTTTRKLTVLWFGGVGMFSVGALAAAKPLGLALLQVGLITSGVWVAVAVLVWIARPLLARQSSTP